MLGLRFCARAFSSCGKRGPLFIAVRGPLTIVASLVVEHRLQTRRLSICGSRAYLLRGMWDLPRPGLEPVSPALAGRFSTTAPPGNPGLLFLWWAQALGFSLNTGTYYQIWKTGWFSQYGFRAPSHVDTTLIGPIAIHPRPRLSSYHTSLYNEHLLPLTLWYSSVSHFCKACGSSTSLIPPSTLLAPWVMLLTKMCQD